LDCFEVAEVLIVFNSLGAKEKNEILQGIQSETLEEHQSR
jgi:hypothetical protein